MLEEKIEAKVYVYQGNGIASLYPKFTTTKLHNQSAPPLSFKSDFRQGLKKVL